MFELLHLLRLRIPQRVRLLSSSDHDAPLRYREIVIPFPSQSPNIRNVAVCTSNRDRQLSSRWVEFDFRNFISFIHTWVRAHSSVCRHRRDAITNNNNKRTLRKYDMIRYDRALSWHKRSLTHSHTDESNLIASAMDTTFLPHSLTCKQKVKKTHSLIEALNIVPDGRQRIARCVLGAHRIDSMRVRRSTSA